ncbi:MAG: PilW family protein [Massilia sp.]|nr:PilW family protein [Massilia sp.]
MIEMMVALAISLVLLMGLSSIFVSSLRSGAEIERANQQIENGRYAIQLLSDDLRNAGQLAGFSPGPLATPALKPDPCATDLATLKAALPIAVQGYDNAAVVPSCISDVLAGTDILVIRRASTCAIGEANCDAAVAGAPYFQASGCSSATELSSTNATNYFALDTATTNLILHQKDCVTPAAVYRYRTHIYFVAANDKLGDGIPTLKRAELGVAGFTIVPLVAGIQNLQIEYGIDSAVPTTGTPALYTADPDSVGSCAGLACVTYWRNTVAAKVIVLARNTSLSSGYTDKQKVYSLGQKFNGSAHTVGPFDDGYRRHLYQAVVRLNNTAGRNTP